jgi:hypothetical protein
MILEAKMMATTTTSTRVYWMFRHDIVDDAMHWLLVRVVERVYRWYHRILSLHNEGECCEELLGYEQPVVGRLNIPEFVSLHYPTIAGVVRVTMEF